MVSQRGFSLASFALGTPGLGALWVRRQVRPNPPLVTTLMGVESYNQQEANPPPGRTLHYLLATIAKTPVKYPNPYNSFRGFQTSWEW